MDIKRQASEKIENIIKSLGSGSISTSPVVEKQYNYEIEVTAGGEKIKVQVYFGKKGVRTILQGNTGSNLYSNVQKIITEEPQLAFPKQTIDEPESYIGSDESGKGDIFGPLVTAAVYADSSMKKSLDSIGVRDSKDLSDNQIGELASLIEMNNQENYEIVLITPAKYNELYDKFRNLNKLLNWSHSKAVENLLARKNCKTVITDKFENKNLSISRSGKGINVEFIQTPKAERYTAVAAASILARNAFNKWFFSQRSKGYDLPKGASEHVALKARQIFNKSGNIELQTLAKMHFKTIKKIQSS